MHPLEQETIRRLNQENLDFTPYTEEVTIKDPDDITLDPSKTNRFLERLQRGLFYIPQRR